MRSRLTLRRALDEAIAGAAPAGDECRVPGGHAEVIGPGIIRLLPEQPRPRIAASVLSVAVHGNETAPVELLCQVADRLDGGAFQLGAPTLLIVGHPASIAAGTRYLETNLNRLFRRGNAGASGEHARAAELMNAVDAFWAQYRMPYDAVSSTARLPMHLDLHTAIRASRYPRFAVEPYAETAMPATIWPVLAAAGLQAVLAQHRSSWTFSHYSRHYFDVPAFTLELGRVAPFGANDLDVLAPMAALLRARLAGVEPPAATADELIFFQVVHELMRDSDDFALAFAEDIANFTAFEVGEVIARDPEHGDTVVEDAPLVVVFPNAHVERGARAALLARPVASPPMV